MEINLRRRDSISSESTYSDAGRDSAYGSLPTQGDWPINDQKPVLKLTNLPTEIVQLIATNLDNKSLVTLAQTCKPIRARLEHTYTKKCITAAKNARTLSEIKKFLVSIDDGVSAFPRSTKLQIRVLEALTPSIALMPDGKRRFNAIDFFLQTLNTPKPLTSERTAIAQELRNQLFSSALADCTTSVVNFEDFIKLLNFIAGKTSQAPIAIDDIPICKKSIQDEIGKKEYEATYREFKALLPAKVEAFSSDHPGPVIPNPLEHPLRIKPLLALASRLHVLEEHQKVPARSKLLEVINDIPESSLPSDYYSVLMKLKKVLVGDLENLREITCDIALAMGESVRTVARRSGIDDNDKYLLQKLNFNAMGLHVLPLLEKYSHKVSVHELCKRFGISNTDLRSAIEIDVISKRTLHLML